MECKEFTVRSSYDGTEQPFLFAAAEGEGERPLLVALHTWSYDRFNQIKNMLPVAEEFGMHLLLPEFRGSNLESNPHCTEACGSDAAIRDIYDDIEYVCAHYPIDRENIFLTGLSGGGHMTLLTLKEKPTFFKAASTFVAITDLALWAEQNAHYRPHILACTGGDPAELAKRSPIHYVDRLKDANLKLFHGRSDGTVPMDHSLRLYLAIHEKYPDASVYLDIFKGRHQISLALFREWLAGELKQKKNTEVTG